MVLMKYTEEFIRSIAQSKNGDLIEIFYAGKERRARVKCENNHIWDMRATNIEKYWCSECRKYSISDMRQYALDNEGECLSNIYVNVSTKLRWKCKLNHIFETTPAMIIKGSWCLACYNLSRIPTQEDVEQLADNKNGKCLSIYKDSRSKMTWQCDKMHMWETTYNKIQQGTWCPVCNLPEIPDQNAIDNFASKKDGKCLSEYINISKKMVWQCSKYHEWEACWDNIKNGHWCPECYYMSMKNTQHDADQLAINRGGQCLSEYTYANDIMLWKCSKNHTWETSYSCIKKGSWCPKCRNKTEQYCRSVLENLFNCEFPTVRPSWLVNDKNIPIELDGYNKQMKIAFEYNGEQHYKIVDRFNMTEAHLTKQQEHDKIKLEECIKRDIILIVIPYTLKTKKEIRNFIYNELFDWTLDEYSDADLPSELII